MNVRILIIEWFYGIVLIFGFCMLCGNISVDSVSKIDAVESIEMAMRGAAGGGMG